MYKPTYIKTYNYLNPTTGEWTEDYQVISMNRDSDPLEESNFQVMYKRMMNEWVKYNIDKPFGIIRFRSSAVGWVDWIMLDQHAPEELIKFCDETIKYLEEEYGCLDEMDYSEREAELEENNNE